MAMKGQILANLVVELGDSKEVRKPEEVVGVSSILTQQPWHLFVDGVTNQRGLGIGIVIISPDGIILEKSLRLGFSPINSRAEYEAPQVELAAVQKPRGKFVKAYCDSRLVARQVRGDYEAKDPQMLWYLNQIKRLSGGFHSFTLE